MPVDVLEHGPDTGPTPPRARTRALVLAALAVVAVGAVQVSGPPWERDAQPPPGDPLQAARVLSVRPAPGDVLHVHVEVVGVPRAVLLSTAVDLPGSDVVLLRRPDRLTDDGTALLALDVLPRCPGAVDGLSQAEVRAVVRGRQGAPEQRARVSLGRADELADAVRTRCGARPALRTTAVVLDGPRGIPLTTRVEVSASDAGPVTVVAVRPGPGLEASSSTPLPVVLSPGDAAVAVRVDLRRGGCGGAPDTPPYVLVLSTGEVVAPPVAPEVLPLLDALRPFPCGT